MPAMLNGMCGRCGKEPLQGIGSDKKIMRYYIALVVVQTNTNG